jgi:hypothetical protein
MIETKVNPVELLRDAKGVYGIGLNTEFPFDDPPFGDEHVPVHHQPISPVPEGDSIDEEMDYFLQLAGAMPEPAASEKRSVESYRTYDRRPKTRPLILRPDRFPDGEELGYSDGNAALQMIPPRGFGQMHSLEQQLDGVIAQFILHRCGAGRENENKRKYHGTLRIAQKIMNHQIFQAIEQAADPDAIRAARRFHYTYREVIYRAITRNSRLLQLVETFPMLLQHLFLTNWVEQCREEKKARQAEAIRLVNRGASLRRVAAAMDMPMHLRRIKPGALVDRSMPTAYIEGGGDTLWTDARLVRAHLPETTAESRRWLMAVYRAERKAISPEFVRWVARNAHLFPAGRHVTYTYPPDQDGPRRRRFWMPAREEMKQLIDDFADFVRACKRHEGHVVRPFRESMSLKTVTELSAEWHKAVQDTDGPQYTFPPPWYPAGSFAGYDLVPLTSSTDLYQEGRTMHNCVASYGERVVDGDCYIYSVRQNGERVATAEVAKHDGKVHVGQVRNNCNRPAPEIEFVVREWLSRQAPGLNRAA